MVAVGPADAPPDTSKWASQAVPGERQALLDWWVPSARQLLDALWESGPGRACWSWWGTSQWPQTSGAAARHQLHESAVHTYGAQIAAGAPQPLPGSTRTQPTPPWGHGR
ncbi:maleylpyruvate isomerase N-terminal domain-containing protein [Streptomyces sp. PA03-5A]|nr:maleylpyruvate isomerase N-terminal domain-containing protein [Streptomyces sp. PA03-5A]